jgi:hypothetical protein
LGQCDNPIWTISKKGVYISYETWEVLRKKSAKVVWWKIIWFPWAIPKYAFILHVKGYLNGVIRVRLNDVSVIASWKLEIIYFFNSILVLEYGIIAWLDADLIDLW